MNGILCDNEIKLDRCRSRLLLLVTIMTMEKCTDFINKIRECRFIKVRDRQVNKFNRLMESKDRELTAQPLANHNQLQAQNNSNKWVVNLSSTPLAQFQESPFSKGPNYAVAPNPPTWIYYFYRVSLPGVKSPRRRELRADINRVLMSSHTPNQTVPKKN